MPNVTKNGSPRKVRRQPDLEADLLEHTEAAEFAADLLSAAEAAAEDAYHRSRTARRHADDMTEWLADLASLISEHDAD